jgi:hypothetical protein
MRKNTYSKILLAPIAALILGACSSKLHNQSQEYDDIYFTKADRNKATATEKATPQSINTTEEELPIINKTYSSEEYSPQYVDPALVEKFNNNNALGLASNAGLIVKDVNYLSFNNFVSDYEQNYVEFKDLPLDWGKGYWSETQFDNRVASDYQFRNAWYDYYYNGYEGSLNNYFEQASARQTYASNNNFYSPIAFRPRISLSFGVGYMYSNDPFHRPYYSAYQDPFYDPYYYGAIPYYGYTNPLFTSANFYIGSPVWCPPNYSYRPSYNNNYPFYPSTPENPAYGNETSDKNVTRGPRNGRRVIASVQDDLTNGTSPGTRSAANLNSSSLDARNSVNGNYGNTATARSIKNGRTSKNRFDDIDNVRNGYDLPARTRTSAVTVNSRNSRISSDDYSFSPKTKTRKSSDLRSRTSSTYTKPAKNNFERSSRNTNKVSSFSRIDYGTSKNSRNTYSRPSNSRSSSSFNKSSRSNSSGMTRTAPSRSRSSTSNISKSTRGSSRSSSSSSTKSSSSSKKSGRSN